MNLIFIYALLYDPSDLYMLHIYIFMYALYIYASRYEECLILTRNTNEDLKNFSFFFFQVSRLSNLFFDGIIRVFVIVTSNDKSIEKLRKKNLTDTRKGLRSILYITRFEVE